MKLRPMTMEDAEKMLEWKNYPETRKFTTVTHKKILKKNHLVWLSKNIQYFRVVTNSRRLGAVRVQDGEISLWVDRKYRKKGIAKWIVNQVAKRGSTAKIVEGHLVSMRTFISCGFKPVSYQKGYYIFQK